MIARLVGNRRIYIRGRRIHHGLTGAVLVLIGVVFMLDDWADRPWRFGE